MRALVVAATLLVLPAVAADDAYSKTAAFRVEPSVDGAYARGHVFDLTPADGGRLPYDAAGYDVPAAWEVPGDPTEATGLGPAWTSLPYAVRFTRPDGAWTEVRSDDRDLLVRTSAGETARYAGYNFTDADLDRCLASDGDRCLRFADDTLFSTVAFHARAPGAYALALTVTDANGDARAYATRFHIEPRAPDAPRGLLALPYGPGAVRLTWSAPHDDGGAPVERYEVRRDGALVGTSAERDFVDTGASTGLHSYDVRAVNALGAGPPSRAATTAAAHLGP